MDRRITGKSRHVIQRNAFFSRVLCLHRFSLVLATEFSLSMASSPLALTDFPYPCLTAVVCLHPTYRYILITHLNPGERYVFRLTHLPTFTNLSSSRTNIAYPRARATGVVEVPFYLAFKTLHSPSLSLNILAFYKRLVFMSYPGSPENKFTQVHGNNLQGDGGRSLEGE